MSTGDIPRQQQTLQETWIHSSIKIDEFIF
jgi:hypothetical protein